ncbi:alkaline phosphatase D family protein [Comamonas testosteroni]|uniref:alkaline phosphatase D family protein n=1 Tax=Comamonas testosteroni TaxID=285 RepID=UPI0023AAC509|nr:alkaline phosphatase D family protein [Comamonas testosteroni]WEE79796.1 alkaline phosphatase D family protein [Comamonas testosteroni]
MLRRDIFRIASSSAITTSLPRWARSRTLTQRDLFALGVASGSPSPDGFVLWTRLLNGPVPGTVGAVAERIPLPDALTVQWEIAEDDQFRKIVRSGTAQALAALGHSVHVEITGLLPGRWYYYRFMHGDAVTPAARTRTAPPLGSMPDKARFSFVSCQRWEQGHYAGYAHMLDEDLDAVLFLGDYIYEYAMPTQPSSAPIVRTHTLELAQSLNDFRDRYALYRSDPQLQAAHRACPWIVSWDDHEVQNDYAGTRGNGSPAEVLSLRNHGYQAFYENMPLRASSLPLGISGLGTPDGVKIYDRYTWGRLLNFHMLDTRQYSDAQACRPAGGKPLKSVNRFKCPEMLDPNRSMLGHAQERWLEKGLQQDAQSETRWTVLAQQTIFSQRNYKIAPEESFHSGTWDAFPAARQRLIDAMSSCGNRNNVLLGGDIHQNYVSKVLSNFNDPGSATIASEFCGTSITSHSSTSQKRAREIADGNPHILLACSEKRGYCVAEVSAERWVTHLRTLNDVTSKDSGISTLAHFVVEDRRPGPIQL